MCKRCGKETVVIGYEESSQLDVEPAKYFVLFTKREKRACRSCEELGVSSAPLPPRIPAGLAPAAPATPPAHRRRRCSLASVSNHHTAARSASPCSASSPPRRDEDLCLYRPAAPVADCEPGYLGVAPPLPLAGHDHVHVEGGEQPEAFRAGIIVDAREGLVERDQPWRMGVGRRLVVRRRRGEQRNGGDQARSPPDAGRWRDATGRQRSAGS